MAGRQSNLNCGHPANPLCSRAMSDNLSEDVTVKCPNCHQLVREHYSRFDPDAGPSEQACPACGEMVDLAEAAFEVWLAAREAERGPPDLIMTGTCPGCGAMPQSKYWGDLSEVDYSDHCEECDLTFPMIPDRVVKLLVCPKCDKNLSPSTSICPSCGLRVVPSCCPNCHSGDLLVVTPAQPIFFSPISIAGLFAGAVAGAVADSLYSNFCRCRACGHEWR